MSDFQQLARRLAPVLVALMDEPFWVSLCRATPDCSAGPDEPVLDFWVGEGFGDWCPQEDCSAIIAVTPATAFAVRVPAAARPRPRYRSSVRRKPAHRRGELARLVCAVSAEGETYAALKLPDGPLAQGEPEGGRLLDLLLAKFGLPPGPPCPYDIELRGEPD